jgi:hypothetical protein
MRVPVSTADSRLLQHAAGLRRLPLPYDWEIGLAVDSQRDGQCSFAGKLFAATAASSNPDAGAEEPRGGERANPTLSLVSKQFIVGQLAV